MIDTILRDGHTIEAILPHPCRHVGARKDYRIKSECGEQASFLPVYECSEFLRCSPFGGCTDENIVKPCKGCERYVKVA